MGDGRTELAGDVRDPGIGRVDSPVTPYAFRACSHALTATEPHRSVLAYARKVAQHAAALRDHPNIAAVHDVVEHEGLPWSLRAAQSSTSSALLRM